MNRSGNGQVLSLKDKIGKIVAGKALELGFAFYDFSTGDTFSINGNKRFPVQSSVSKFPIALPMLHEIDNRNFEPDQKIYIGKENFRHGLWGSVEKKYSGGNVRLS